MFHPERPILKSLLLITAAVQPVGVPTLVRHDWDERRTDYCRALEFYASTLDPRQFDLLMIENTGAALEPFVALAHKFGHELKTISYVEDSSINQKGKGNAEARILSRAIDWIEDQARTYQRIVKVTGRLVVKNIASIIQRSPADGRFIAIRIKASLDYADTKLFIVDSSTFCNHFRNLETLVDETNGKYLEHAVARTMSDALYHGAKWAPFKRVPKIHGVSASTGAHYGTASENIKNYIGWISGIAATKSYL